MIKFELIISPRCAPFSLLSTSDNVVDSKKRCTQDRITDHRIPLTISGLSDAMEGGETLDMISRELELKEQEEALESIIAHGII